jgi:hypothetical protein
MPVHDKTIEKISSFSKLMEGWHYESGGPISQPVISQAIFVYWNLKIDGVAKTDAFAGESGEILVTAYRGTDEYIGVIINPTGFMSFRHEIGDNEIKYLETNKMDEIIFALRDAVRGTQWTTYVSYTPGILNMSATASMNFLLKNVQRDECPLYIENALSAMVPYVVTSGNIMRS